MIQDEKYISCALFLYGYLKPFPARSTTNWNEIHYIANSIKRHIEGNNYNPIHKDWADKGSVLHQLRISAKERGQKNI